MIKLVKEEKEIIEPIAAEDSLLDLNNQQPTEEEIELANKACEEMVNNLVRKSWEFIAEVNSTVATIEENFEKAVKPKVIELLNVVIDDSTINIGVLQKIINIMNTETETLLDAGESKAEKILKEPKAEN